MDDFIFSVNATIPIFLMILLGLACPLARFHIPSIPAKTINYIVRTATPITLIAVGIGFNVNEALVRIKPIRCNIY